MSLGEALTVLRSAAAMTQQSVAAAAGVTQAALSRYEHNLREPDDATLAALAETLGVTVRFLDQPDRLRGAFMVDAHMRRRGSAKPSLWRHMEARLNVCRMHLERLAQAAELDPALSLPFFDPLERSPAEAARLTRMQWRMPAGPVRDLTGWLESAGCVIVEQDFGPGAGNGRADALSQWAPHATVMLVNRYIPADQLRVAMAHELGHMCLHNGQLGDDPEDEADAFAAEFLTPETVIGDDLRYLEADKLRDLKVCWGVPMRMLIDRAHQLRAISAGQRQTLRRTLTRRGWNACEPFSDEIAPEIPYLAVKLAQTLLDTGLTAAELAAIAGASPNSGGLFFLPEPLPPAARAVTLNDLLSRQEHAAFVRTLEQDPDLATI